MFSTLFRATSSRAVQTRSLLLASAVAVPAARARVAPHFLNSTRAYSTEPVKSSGSSTALWWGVGLLGASAGYYFYSSSTPAKPVVALKKEEKKPLDYNEVYKAIADILDEDPDYDDGSYGPILIRLAWHASGTYDKTDGTGGSNGATMRLDPEGAHGANAGLAHARDVLEKIKKRFPDISYSDLWTLAGVVAVQEAGGPTVPWRAGRVDKLSSTDCPPDGRLPDAAQGQDHIRNIFYRMGFNDQEIVALAGAHALGRCHTDRSGFDGPWTPSPTLFTNDYYKQLLNQKWVEKKWKGPKQFVDKATGELMMLPADMAFVADKQFKKFVDIYAKDEKKFFDDFSAAFSKLIHLGVPYKGDEKVYQFPTLNA